MKNLNKRRLSTFLFLLKKRLFACVAKAGKRKNECKNNIDVICNDNDNNNQHVEARGLENRSASTEIKIQDEDGSIATCRICLECEVDEDDHLISPCICKGTLKFVHRSCLDRWRSVRAGFDFSHCPTCKAQFHLRVFNKTSWSTTKFKLFVTRDIFLVFLFVQTMIGMMGGLAYLADTHLSLLNHSWFRILPTHPISFYYCVGVITFSVLVYLLAVRRAIIKCYYNYNNLLRKIKQNGPCFYWLPESVDLCLCVLIATAVTLTLVGIFYGYYTATRAIKGIWRSHSHILVIDYTQKYVVEDLKGCYSPAILDPEEMERLRMLKLL